MRCEIPYLLLCFGILLSLHLVTQHVPSPYVGDCQQLVTAFDRYVNTTEWNFDNYQTIPSVWVFGTLVRIERLDADVVEVTLRGEEREGTFVFIVPAYAASRYHLHEGYAFDIGNYERHFLQMADSRAQTISYSTEPALLPARCS